MYVCVYALNTSSQYKLSGFYTTLPTYVILRILTVSTVCVHYVSMYVYTYVRSVCKMPAITKRMLTINQI